MMFLRQSWMLFFALCANVLLGQKIGDLYPDSQELIQKGIEYHENGDDKKAIEQYEKVVNGDSLYYLALYELALSQNADSSQLDAVKTLNVLLSFQTPYEMEGMLLRGNAYDDAKMTEQAMEAYATAIAKYPHINRVYYERGLASVNAKMYDKGLADFEMSRRMNSYHTRTHGAIGLMALEAKQPALAMMALYFASLLCGDNPQLGYSYIEIMDKISSGTYEYEYEGLNPELFNFCEDLSDINEVVLSGTALNEKYKSKLKLSYTHIKQMQIICEMIADRPSGNNPILSFYMDFYKKMWKENQFIPMMLQPLATNTNPLIAKQVKKNNSKIAKFNADAGAWIEQRHLDVEYMVDGKPTTGNFYYTDGKLIAMGEIDKSGMLQGPFTYFHNNGRVSAKGEFVNTQKEGLWQYYNYSGYLDKSESFVNGVNNGLVKTYDGFGVLKEVYNVSDNKASGLVNEYASNGAPYREYSIVNGQIEGAFVEFDSFGRKESETTVKADKPTGYKAYNTDGSLRLELTMKEGKLDGTAIYRGIKGNIETEGAFKAGERTGVWKDYYKNGKLYSEGEYQDGKKTGLWKEYDRDGVLREEAIYKNGKLDGTVKTYNGSGKLVAELNYKSGKAISYKYFDINGGVLQEAKSSGGKLPVKTFGELYNIASEGSIEKEDRVGEWTFYDLAGNKTAVTNYKNGVANGVNTVYYGNGEVKSEFFYKDDEPSGYYRFYNEHGSLSEDGYYKDGQLHGQAIEYYPNQEIETISFYWNGELNGYRTYYHQGGQIQKRELYQFGVMTAVESFDENSNVIYRHEIPGGNGQYVLKFKDGSPYFSIDYKYNRFDGTSVTLDPEGKVDPNGAWKSGRRDGYVRFENHGLPVSEGNYVDGSEEGLWKYYDEFAKIEREINYEEGDREGKYIVYYENGKVFQERNYRADEKLGEHRIYGEDGSLGGILNFYDGILVSYTYPDKGGKLVAPIEVKGNSGKIVTYYANGKKCFELELLNGMYINEFNYYFTTGKPHQKWLYDRDWLTGKYQEFYINGQKREESEYKYDKYTGLRKMYYDNGKVNSEVNYLLGDRHGEAKYYDKNGKVISTGQYYYGDYFPKK